MIVLVWLFVGTAMLGVWSGDVAEAQVFATLAVAASVLRLRPGTVSKMWRDELDKAEARKHERQIEL